MLRPIPIVAALLAFLASAPVWADDTGANAPVMRHVTLVEGGALISTGQAYAIPLTGSTGLFGWGAGYKLDAGVQPNLAGGYTAGLGATVGAAPGEQGSGYSLRIGGGWAGDRFSVNPYSRLGISEVATPASDVALSFTYSHSIMPGLSLTGSAEAYRPVGPSLLDPTGGSGQVLVGAGLGLRF